MTQADSTTHPAPQPWTLGHVLGVWAHPDDETWLSAIHMARAVEAGYRVACVTATRGELGSPDPERWPPGEPLARVRTAELDTALAVLGVDDHTWLDYADGGCAEVGDDEGASRVLEHLGRARPDTVLTFGPDGMTGHSDHQAVSRWVDLAVERYEGSRPRVLHATNTPEWLGLWKSKLDSLGVYMGSQPPCTPRADLQSYLSLTAAETDRKVRALTSQVSQVGPLVDAFGAEAFRTAMSEESFQ